MEQPQHVVRQGPRTWVVVALTLAAVLVVALSFVGGLVTGIAIGGSGTAAPAPVPDGDPGGDAGGGSGTDGSIDPCVVGTWRTVEQTESADTEQGRVTISGVTRTLEFAEDGTETVTYDGTPATVTTDAGAGEAVFEGTVVYRASTAGSTMSFELVSVDGTLTVSAGDGEPETQELQPGTGDVSYTCTEDRLTQESPGFRSVLERVP